MATDDYMMHFQYTPPVYPIIVTYDWTIELSNGFVSLPSFAPQTGYDVEVNHTSYKLITQMTIHVDTNV